MAAHQEELCGAHVNCDRALVEWAGLKEHMVQHFGTVQMSKMWEALAPERAHAQWVNVWRVLALLRAYCPAEAAVERAISLRGRFRSNMHDIVETHVLSMCMALHSNLPPLQQWAKGQVVAVARHLAARASFDLHPRQRVSRKVSERESLEAAMLQCLQGNEAVAAFLANVPLVARHLDSKVQRSTKEEDVWENCHDASLLAWGVVYGDILHGMRCFNSVAQLRAPTGAHLATATGMLQARLQKVACEEGQGWLQFKEQTATGAWHGVQLVQFDSGGQKCVTTPPFPGVQARAVTDALLAGIKEGQATIDPRGCWSAQYCWTMAVSLASRSMSVLHMG